MQAFMQRYVYFSPCQIKVTLLAKNLFVKINGLVIRPNPDLPC